MNERRAAPFDCALTGTPIQTPARKDNFSADLDRHCDAVR
jgi:hypothetical protein